MRKNLDIIIAYSIMLGLIILVGFFTVMEYGIINFVFLFDLCSNDNGSKHSMGICRIN